MASTLHAPVGTALTRRAPAAPAARAAHDTPRRHLAWLAGGAAMSFAVPYVLADRLGIQRDRLAALLVSGCGGGLAHEPAGRRHRVVRLRTLARVQPIGDLDLALPLEEDRFPAHLVVILPQDAGTG